jgi:hypothetical protein
VGDGIFRYDQLLSDLSLKYSNIDFVANRVFPALPRDLKSGKFAIFGPENLTPQEDLRAPGDEAKIARWSVGTPGSYYCDGHAMKDKVNREDQEDVGPNFDLIQETTLNLTERAQLNKEVALVTKLAAGMTGSSLAAQTSTPWDDDDEDPLAIIKAQKLVIALRTGKIPNIFVASAPVWSAISLNANIRGLITGAGTLPAALITPEMFARLLEVDEVIVAGAVKNTAIEGQPASNAWVWGETALLAVRAPTPGQRMVSLGYTFQWRKAMNVLTGGSAAGFAGVERYYWQPNKADFIEVHEYYDLNIVGAAAGVLFTNCLQ